MLDKIAGLLFRDNFHLVLHDAELGTDVDYMTKYKVLQFPRWSWLGKFSEATMHLHHFFQGEPETDAFHDHEFTFYSFPFAPYQEGLIGDDGHVKTNIVPSWRWSRRDPGVYHVVYGLWHPAGKYEMGAVNKFKSFWTINIKLKAYRDFGVARFEHPDGTTYNDFTWEADGADPRPYWTVHTFDARQQREREGVPLFVDGTMRQEDVVA